jgi:hypothetical protein
MIGADAAQSKGNGGAYTLAYELPGGTFIVLARLLFYNCLLLELFRRFAFGRVRFIRFGHFGIIEEREGEGYCL